MIKKKQSKKVSGVLDKIKRHTNTAKKNITYNVIDKVYKSANKKDKAPLKKAKELIKNTYLGNIHKDTKSHNVKINVLSGINEKLNFNEKVGVIFAHMKIVQDKIINREKLTPYEEKLFKYTTMYGFYNGSKKAVRDKLI